MLTTPVLTAVAVAVAIAALAFYDGRDRAGEVGSKSAAVVSGLGVLLVAFVSWSVAAQRPPLAEGDLRGDAVLNVPALDARIAVLVQAELPAVKAGESAGGHYQLDVHEGETLLTTLDGEVSETWRQGRAGRRGHTQNLVTHLEHRFDLPNEGIGQAMIISVGKETGDLHAPIHIVAESAPPQTQTVALLAVLAALTATGADAFGGGKTRSGIWVALQGALAYTMLDGVYPHSTAMAVVGAAMFAAVVGIPAGLLLRWTLMPLFRALLSRRGGPPQAQPSA